MSNIFNEETNLIEKTAYKLGFECFRIQADNQLDTETKKKYTLIAHAREEELEEIAATILKLPSDVMNDIMGAFEVGKQGANLKKYAIGYDGKNAKGETAVLYLDIFRDDVETITAKPDEVKQFFSKTAAQKWYDENVLTELHKKFYKIKEIITK